MAEFMGIAQAIVRTPTSCWWRTPVINRRAWQWEDAHHRRHLGQWWQHAVIYQVFPWSFQDSSGNGLGDLQGILDRLSYIRALGVDAIWLTPIYPSKHEDAGYAVTQLDEIDPWLGDLEQFKALLAVAHDCGLKLLLDQVWNHTADGHPWFIESAGDRENPRADWYVWADADLQGGPPNNWLSAFTGGSAWHWHPSRQQYYLANFLPSQPELNWHCPAVVDALLTKARFWLDLGVDGFRVDAVNFFTHDPDLSDNPQRHAGDPLPDGIDPSNPMAQQRFINSFCRPTTLTKLSQIRSLLDQYPQVVSLGEVTLCEDSIALSGQYVTASEAAAPRLHLAYNSALLQDQPLSTTMLRDIMAKTQQHFPGGGQCWMVGNHDYQRLRSRWTGKDAAGNPYPDDFYRMIAALLIALPGALCLYQGDELGLPLGEIPEDIAPAQIQDPFGKEMYPQLPGRDGSRTPMPWQQDAPNQGFTTASQPWLPIPESHRGLSVDQQNRDPNSLLNTWRRLLQWRKAQPALIAGGYEPLAAHDAVFAFRRHYAEQRLFCLFNLSGQEQEFALPRPPNRGEIHLLAINQQKISFSTRSNLTAQNHFASHATASASLAKTVDSATQESDRPLIQCAPYAALFISETKRVI